MLNLLTPAQVALMLQWWYNRIVLLKRQKGVIKMSKIFNISGNFLENGDWAKPDPAFEGKIAVDENGKFCGWCEQACVEGLSDCREGKPCDSYQTRCLIGALAEEGDGYSLLFFKLSNDECQSPLSYEIHATSTADCVWSAKDPGGGFVARGNAKVSLEELQYSNNDADNIRKRFHEMYVSTIENDVLLQRVGSLQPKTLVLWT